MSTFKEYVNMINESSYIDKSYHRTYKRESSFIKNSIHTAVKSNISEWDEDPSKYNIELFIEKGRPNNKPSRFKCFFSSPVKNSAFNSYRPFVYEVLPLGKIHIADSRILDEIIKVYENENNNEDDINDNEDLFSLIDSYWNVSYSHIMSSVPSKFIEILSEKIKIL